MRKLKKITYKIPYTHREAIKDTATVVVFGLLTVAIVTLAIMSGVDRTVKQECGENGNKNNELPWCKSYKIEQNKGGEK